MDLKFDKSNWKKVVLDDVVTKIEENDRENAHKRFDRFLKVEHMDAESLHIKRWASQEQGDEINPTFFKIFRKGQMLFPTRNPHLRRTVLASFDGICGEKTLTLQPNEEFILPEFIPFLFHSEGFYAHTTSSIIGSTNPHCRWRDVASYEFLIPRKEQQAEIAELLWAMEEVIESEVKLLNSLDIYRKSFFSDLINSSTGRVSPLSELLIPKKSKSKPPHENEKYIGLEHVISGEYECTEFGSSGKALTQCNLVESGDLCYSKLRPYLDKAFIASFDAVSTTELLIYDTKDVTKKYVLFHLHSDEFVHFVSGKGFGTKMPRVSHKIIGEYEIKVPTNEHEILDKMETVMGAYKSAKAKLIRSKTLQKSLINQVF
ncbi:restriction endonuclease subunit S [Pontiella agarivorans]|uniref:Restriction endonuclease subunit S n=1 Tax=Pontiella agarivorans TaxID=3038953 RepID=A0ABU5MTC5_9BACT|nr:restriction endonuclease subunit S [Pontiella agarivorans]MDZ8117392.1 restriction endonuclease subunit S [Pontiella agarivorans]